LLICWKKGKPILARPTRAQRMRTRSPQARPTCANVPRRESPRARRPTCKNALAFSYNTTNTMCAISTDYDFAIKPSQTPSFTTAWSSVTRARRRAGDGIGRPRRPAGTCAVSTNGTTPVYNPSAYTSLGYRSGEARGSGDHGTRPCTIVARPCRPP